MRAYDKPCKLKNCDKPARGGKGFCNSHYHKQHRYGNPEGGQGYAPRHGLRNKFLSEYRAWVSMKSRCSNTKVPCYHAYGGRGIKVCKEWDESFPQFLRDLGPKPGPEYSIERIDVNGDYEPDNCKWATAKEQVNNRRITAFITYKGVTKSRSEWEDQLEMKRHTLYDRINRRGWSIEKAIETPIKTWASQ
jgi:hypothetical protein